MMGTLSIVSTPIGNLEDLTFRALRILREVSVIAAEDTRRTQKLCVHYGIATPLTSYHDFNKEEKTPVLIKRLQEGAHIALVSDSGTPLVSDPGYYLVKHAKAAKIPVVSVPGPSAVLAALAASGLPTDAFVFEGFLPRKAGAKTQLLKSLADERRTIILFETPHRLRSTLEVIRETFGHRRLAVARELTKFHEEVLQGDIEEILEAYTARKAKGEITLVIEGRKPGKKRKSNQSQT